MVIKLNEETGLLDPDFQAISQNNVDCWTLLQKDLSLQLDYLKTDLPNSVDRLYSICFAEQNEIETKYEETLDLHVTFKPRLVSMYDLKYGSVNML